MQVRKSAAVSITIGIALLIATALFYIFALPGFEKLPANLDVTAEYEGQATMLNNSALSSGDLANAVLKDIPITVQRRMYVSSSTSDTAIYHEDTRIQGPNGLSINASHIYAVDRKSLDSGVAPSGTAVEAHTGLTAAFPADPPADDSMLLWDSYTQKPVAAKYAGSEKISGRKVNRYDMTTDGALQDPAMLRSLPAVLPKAVVEQMIPIVSAQSRTALQESLPTTGDPVPITYHSTGTLSLGVDRQIGSPIDGSQKQTITAVAHVGDRSIDLVPVMVTDVQTTAATRASAADTMHSAGRVLTLFTVVAPLAVIVLGIVLIALGIVLNRRRNI
ncbi:porin PorA family protein [Nocardia aobensis]|uniref:Porin PorA family protein n=1 Tax=Nocardia aobensis TaxID=257277 RepID=A0ABW6PF37_9NOCA